jgi:bifunctional DNA-binding transcriptional regulator/antitoxin component of YhaV-PrlF toxin-antitoxin module
MKATIKVPQDKGHRHHITVPVEIWEKLQLKEGDVLEVDINKVE